MCLIANPPHYNPTCLFVHPSGLERGIRDLWSCICHFAASIINQIRYNESHHEFRYIRDSTSQLPRARLLDDTQSHIEQKKNYENGNSIHFFFCYLFDKKSRTSDSIFYSTLFFVSLFILLYSVHFSVGPFRRSNEK